MSVPRANSRFVYRHRRHLWHLRFIANGPNGRGKRGSWYILHPDFGALRLKLRKRNTRDRHARELFEWLAAGNFNFSN